MATPSYGTGPPQFGQRIDALRAKLDQPGQQKGIHQQLQNLRARQYFRQQRHIPIPFSAQYETTVGNLRNTRDQTLAGLAGKQIATDQQYGINDTTNPYSEARQLETTYAAKRAGTLNNAAASGQLYSGSTQNQMGYARAAYGTAQDNLLRNYQGAIGGISADQVSARNAFITGERQAGADRLQAAAAAPADPTVASRPKFALGYLHDLNQKAQRLDKQGQQRRAAAIRQRIGRLS